MPAPPQPPHGDDTLRRLMGLPVDRLRQVLGSSVEPQQPRARPTLVTVLLYCALRSSGIALDPAAAALVAEFAELQIGEGSRRRGLTTQPPHGDDTLRRLLGLPVDRLRQVLGSSVEPQQPRTTLLTLLLHCGLRSSGIALDPAAAEFIVELVERQIGEGSHRRGLTTRPSLLQSLPAPPPRLHDLLHSRCAQDIARLALRPHGLLTRSVSTLIYFTLLGWTHRAQSQPTRDALQGSRDQGVELEGNEERDQWEQCQYHQGASGDNESVVQKVANDLQPVLLSSVDDAEKFVLSHADPYGFMFSDVVSTVIFEVPNDTSKQIAQRIRDVIQHASKDGIRCGTNMLRILDVNEKVTGLRLPAVRDDNQHGTPSIPDLREVTGLPTVRDDDPHGQHHYQP